MFWNTPDEFLQDGEDGIWVTRRGGVRSLYFSWPTPLCQSKYHLEYPNRYMLDYCHDMMAYRFFKEDPKKVLIIGIGGGSLHKNFYNMYPECDVTSVDIDQNVIEVAIIHFDVKIDKRSRLIDSPGDVFVAHTKEKYDLILLDATGDDDTPIRTLSRVEFFQDCKDCLTEDGMLVSNLLYQKEAVRAIITKVFPRTYAILRGSSMWSRIHLSFKQPMEFLTPDLEERVMELNERFGKEEGINYSALLRRVLDDLRSTNRKTII